MSSDKYLMVIANYKDWRQEFFDNHFSKRNQSFADKHGYEYIVSKGGELFRENPTWWKFTLVRDMINSGKLKDGDKIVHLDADMRIDKFDEDFPCEKSFAYSLDCGNTHCMGCYSITVNDWSKNLIELILSEDRYQKLNDAPSVHEAFGYVNPFWHEFREQASWYSLAGIKRHSWVPFSELPDNGWHSAKDENTIYSLKELHENVQILPANWNTTAVIGEGDCKFNINKVDPSEIIIRHFAGGQEWRDE